LKEGGKEGFGSVFFRACPVQGNFHSTTGLCCTPGNHCILS
jgi:hypothetical protein